MCDYVINDALMYLANSIKEKFTSWDEYPDKITNIVKKFIDFNTQQKGKELKILSPKKYFKD